MMKLKSRFFAIAVIGLMLCGVVAANERNTSRKMRKSVSYELKVTPWGPTQADVDAAKVRIIQSVSSLLKDSKYRIVSFEYAGNETVSKNDPTPIPTGFRAVIYNYSTDKSIFAEGDFAGKKEISIRQEEYVPGVSNEELEAAFELVRKDSGFENAAIRNKLDISGAMPPTTILNGERLVNILVNSLEGGQNQIVGVSFKNEKVVRYENNTPPTSIVSPEACGIPSAGQGATSSGVAGQYQLQVMDGANPLWEMLVVRPSASSGASSERSGIEVRDVKYRGKSVLKRGHAPILNVQYINNVCGPYRDWQYSEGFFSAPAAGATDPAPGIRVLADGQVATTAIETRNDTGNFQGVAIYQQDVGYGKEVVLVTEMNAGWYRYIMEWRFAPDGTIRPRYGFASITNSCVCSGRNHHVYWRLDFDIVQSANKVFRVERGRKFLQPLLTETSFLRETQTNRSVLIQNAGGNEAYILTPNLTDGSVTDSAGNLTDTFGGGDFWLTQFKGTAAAPSEIDDPNVGSAANLAPWVNGESLDGQDVVVWYSAHQFRQDDTSLTNRSNIISGVHVIGPDIRPVRW